MKAYSYLRFSTADQLKGDSLRRQTAAAREWCDREGIELDDSLTFQDLGVSAFRGQNGETGRLGDFLEAVKANLVHPGDVLLVESLDRISRQSARRALRVLEAIVDAGVAVTTLSDGKTYTRENLDEDPMSLMMALMIFIRANEESAMKARRVRAAWDHKRAKIGETVLTARGPAWLRLNGNGWHVIEDRAAVVRRIFELFVAGVGQHSIAETLNSERVPVFGEGNRQGKRWYRSYIYKILNNSAVVGQFVPHTLEYVDGRRVRQPQEPIEGYFPAIVERGLWEDAQTLLRSHSPSRGRHAGGPVQNIIGGLARCHRCGEAMTKVSKGTGRLPKLVCSAAKEGAGCTYKTVDYVQIERAIVGNLGTRFIGELGIGADAPATDKMLQGRIEELNQQIAEREGKLNNLIAAIENLAAIEEAASTSAALARRVRETEQELLTLTEERKELERQATAEIGPKQRLDALHKCLSREPLDLTTANSLLRQSAKAVVVDYERKELVLQWQFGGESRLRYDLFPAGRSRMSIR